MKENQVVELVDTKKQTVETDISLWLAHAVMVLVVVTVFVAK